MQAHADLHLTRRAWLVVIALGHLALLMAWRPVARFTQEPTARREGELVFLTQPLPVRQRAAAVPPPRLPAPSRPRPERPAPPPVAIQPPTPDAPAASTEATPQTITLPATPGAPLDPFANAAPVPDSTLDRTRKSAAGIDRQLRKESLNKFATTIQPDTSLGLAISKAQKRDWVLEQDVQNGDGVNMKRYRRGNQEVCEYTNLVGARGQDPFRDGNKTKVMTCP